MSSKFILLYFLDALARTHNSTFAIGGVTCFYDTFVVNGSAVLRVNICAKKPAHRKSAEPLPASLKDDTTRMNDRNKHKQVTGQINHKTADPKANASVFLFFPTAHFLKTILASRTNGTFGYARYTNRPFAKPKEPLFANAPKNHIFYNLKFTIQKQINNMQKTTQHQRGVMGITNLARSINPEIGNYVEHYINEMFGISVKLSNGAISMSVELAQDFEANPNSIDSIRIENVSKTFRKL